MKLFALTLLTLFLSFSSMAQSQKKGVEGVWQLSEVTVTGADGKTETHKAMQPGVYLFTKSHYSIIYVAADKPRMMMDDYSKATKEDLMATFVEQFVANA